MSICAIIVTYHPSAEILQNISALIEQVDEAVIVDNGSGAASKELLEKLSCHPKLSFIYNEENCGIAAALNAGVKHAKAAGHQWVATFDQDSRASPGLIKLMLQAYDAYPEKEMVVSLSPRHQDKVTGRIRGSRLKSPRNKTLPYAESLAVMASGNLIRLTVFDVVGYFNEALFIDHVDTEFCLRCATHGYKILEVNDAILEHRLGSPTPHRFLWERQVIARNYSAQRRYYNARNGIYVYKKYAFVHPAWVARDAFAFLKGMIKVMLFERERKQKLVATCRGVFHGLSGRLGKDGFCAGAYGASDICVSHLVRKKNGIEPFRRFLESYLENPAGIDHDLLILYKGFHRESDIIPYEELLTDVPHSFLMVADFGFDLRSYFIAAERHSSKYFCFLNSFSSILDRDWLFKLYRHIKQPGVGLVGATGSWESISSFMQTKKYSSSIRLVRFVIRKWRSVHFGPFPNCHIRTNGFMISRTAMRRIQHGIILSKMQAYRLESGKSSITRQVERMGLKPVVVGKDGKGYDKKEWDISNTFRHGAQGNLLISDNQTRRFDAASLEKKHALEFSTWGMANEPANSAAGDS